MSAAAQQAIGAVLGGLTLILMGAIIWFRWACWGDDEDGRS